VTQARVEAITGRVAGRPRGTLLLVDRDLITVASMVRDARSLLERGANVATILAAGLGLLTLPLILASLQAARRATRSVRTAEAIDDYDGDKFNKAWERTKPYLDVAGEEACVDLIRGFDRIRGWTQAPDSDIDTVHYLHETIGALFNRGEIDRHLLYRTLAWATVDALARSWWWLHVEREGRRIAVKPQFVRAHESELYAEWERMAGVILRKRPEISLRVKKDQRNRVRALCLPAPEDPQPDWDHCKALSKAVGDALRKPGGLQMLRAKVTAELDGKSQPAHVPRTILIPSLEEYVAAPSPLVVHATRMGAWLDGRGRELDRIRRPRWLRWLGVRLTRLDARVRLHQSYAEVGRDLNRLRGVLDAQAVSDLIADL